MEVSETVFEGELVLEVPSLQSEYGRKMPGDYDGANQGDHCGG